MSAPAPNEVHLVHLALGGGDDVGDAARLLVPAERERADRFRRPELRARWIRARAALRLELARAAACDPAELVLEEGEHGKPYLAPPYESLHFNLSHSGDHGALVLSRARPVGVDLEVLRPVRADAIARRFFAPAEAEAIARLEGEARDRAFLRCWTRKESYVKGLGRGLSLSLSSFEVGIEPGEVVLPAAVTHADSWVLRAFEGPGTVGCVAAPAPAGDGWELVVIGPSGP